MQVRHWVQVLFLAAAVLVATVATPVVAQSDPWGPDERAMAPTQPSDRPAELRIESAAFRLAVPFRTQKDGSRWQTSNCGPATLGMLLDGFGIPDRATDDLRLLAHTYQGTVGWRTGTGLDHVARVGEDFGLKAHGLFGADGGFRRWTVEDVVAELRLGHPVMPLVRLYLVPGYEGMGSRWGHYILLTGLAADGGFYFSDSLKTDPAAGTSGVISERQLTVAIESSHIPGQAVAFSGPRPLEIVLPDR